MLKMHAIVGLILAALVAVNGARADSLGYKAYESSQNSSSQAPQIQTKKESNGSLKGQEKSQSQNTKTNNVISPAPTFPPKFSDDKSAKPTQHSNEERNEYWPSFLGLQLKITDSLLVLFTFFLAIFTCSLSRTTSRIDEHSVASERAYVQLSHTSPGLNLDDSGFTFIKVEVKNFGRTPAKVTDVFLTPKWVDGNRLPDVLPDDNTDSRDTTRAFLVTGGYIFHIEPFPDLLDPRFAYADELKSKTLVIYGYVDYIDKFGQRHRGGYARVYSQKEDDRGLYASDKLYAERSNLVFPGQGRHNYDRRRSPGEGRDWNEPNT